MNDSKNYIPVSCDFIDLIEIKATLGNHVDILYENYEGQELTLNTRLKTWETRSKVEYLITSENVELRLDRVLSIDGIRNEKTCTI